MESKTWPEYKLMTEKDKRVTWFIEREIEKISKLDKGVCLTAVAKE